MIKVYGNSTCSDCIRSKRFLTAHGIDFEYVDVERDPDAEEFVVRVNAGRESIIPTLVFPDGSTMTEPTDAELAAKLGIPIGPQR
jgi:glutaredoxin